MRWPIGLIAVAVATTLSSCTHPAGSAGAPAQVTKITRADIERVHAATALDAVRRFRSDALIARAPSSVYLNKRIYPVVFLNGQFYGQIDALRELPAADIEEIQFISETEAVTKYGSQYAGGIIQIISRVG